MRHLKTVRQHLSGLAFHAPLQNDQLDESWREGLTAKLWQDSLRSQLLENRKEEDCSKRKERINLLAQDIYRRIYFGGVDASIRKEVRKTFLRHESAININFKQIWPYLLGHYKWHFLPAEKDATDEKTKTSYEHKLNDWMTIEAIVKQRDKEVTAANIARLSGGEFDQIGSVKYAPVTNLFKLYFCLTIVVQSLCSEPGQPELPKQPQHEQ